MLLGEAQALVQLGRESDAERIASGIAGEPGATTEERWWAWSCVAGAREARGDHAGAVEALRAAARIRPVPETYRAMGRILEVGLRDPAAALEAYQAFFSAGGRDSTVERRVRLLSGRAGEGR